MNPLLLRLLQSGLATSAARTGIYDAATSYMKANPNIPEWQLRALQAYGKFDQRLFGKPGAGFRNEDLSPEALRAAMERDPTVQKYRDRMAAKLAAQNQARSWAQIEQGK